MLWNTLRGQPTTRNIYEERAKGKPSSIAGSTWKSLCKSQENQAKGKLYLEDVVGSLFIGAQNVNAERVPFQGTIENNLLLHFWIIPTMLYAPRRFDVKGKFEDAGYVFVIPEPAKIISFKNNIIRILRQRETKVVGYRPEKAIIDLPQEAGLEYLFDLTQEDIQNQGYTSNLNSVEIYHLEKTRE